MISKQKRLATLLLTDIKKWNGGNAIVAGGAPRDWFFNLEATDIDVYVESRTEDNSILRRIFTAFLIEKGYDIGHVTSLAPDGADEDYLYGNPAVQLVLSTKFDLGDRFQEVQFIFGPKLDPLLDFPVSISQAYYDGSRETYSAEFVRSIEARTIVYDGHASDSYMNKIRGKFKDMALVPRSHQLAGRVCRRYPF